MVLLLSFLVVLLSIVCVSTASPHRQVIARSGSTRTYPPTDVVGPAPLPEWISTYHRALAAGLIPSFSPSSLVNGQPVYPSSVNLDRACSWTLRHCIAEDDIAAAPDGVIALAFDDGPQLASSALYDFLKQQNVTATHFMIGSRINDNPDTFQHAIRNGEHIGCHTWSHPYMTTLTDLQIVGELGWTNEIIMNQANGLIVKYFRPPYGDIDNRVRAIAKHVFGMTSVIWNHDTNDWCLQQNGGSACGTSGGPTTDAELDKELQDLYHLPKSPGLIILEHELSTRSVGGFIRTYPTLLSQGWIPRAIPDLFSLPWYLNAATDTSDVTASLVGAGNIDATPTSTIAPPAFKPHSIITIPSTINLVAPATLSVLTVTTAASSTPAAKLNSAPSIMIPSLCTATSILSFFSMSLFFIAVS